MRPLDLVPAFDTLAEAPDGVSRLRELVLQLAVRGRLVPQDPDDEPAGVLLARIAEEKRRQVKEGKIRKPKPVPPVAEDEKPVDLPMGWTIVRLGDLTTSFQNGTSKRRGDGPPVVVLRLADIKAGEISQDSFRRIGLSRSDAKKYTVIEGDVLAIRVNGSAHLVGRLIPVRESSGWTYCDHLIRVRVPIDFVSPAYLCLFGETSTARHHIENVTVTTAGQKTVNQTGLGTLPVPLPPLAEQYRIVARVVELMGLLDRLEAARDAREGTRTALRDAALAALQYADTPEKVEVAWERITDRMDDLFTDPSDVDPLRQTVLQLAVRGRLLPQDPNDEPAGVLLERIAGEKVRLVKEGKIRKPKPLRPVSEDELPFDVPEGWVWSSLDDCTLVITDGEHQTPPRVPDGPVPLATAKNVRDGCLDLSNTDFVGQRTAERCWGRCKPETGDILMVCVGATTGRLAVVKNPQPMVLVRSVALLRSPPSAINPDFFAAVLRSPLGQTQVWAKVKQSAQPCLYLGRMRAILIPIPPLPEQHRIVAKIDELIGLLDRLGERLVSMTTAHDAFAAAAVHHLTA